MIFLNTKRFIWLIELIKEKYNSNLIYKQPQKCFPYFKTVYDDDYSIKHIFDCNIDNEEEMKNRMKEIIFNNNIMIKDKKNEF